MTLRAFDEKEVEREGVGKSGILKLHWLERQIGKTLLEGVLLIFINHLKNVHSLLEESIFKQIIRNAEKDLHLKI